MSKSLDLNCAFVVLCFFAVEPQELGEREKWIFILVFSFLVLHILNIMGHIFMKFAVEIYGPQRIIHWPHDIYSIVYSRSKFSFAQKKYQQKYYLKLAIIFTSSVVHSFSLRSDVFHVVLWAFSRQNMSSVHKVAIYIREKNCIFSWD